MSIVPGPLLPLLCLSLLLSGCGHLSRPAANADTVLKGQAVVLLGEVHDNADGHQQRYLLLRQAVDAGWRPAVAMEQFDREHQAALTQAQRDCGQDANCIIRAGGGEGASWTWDYYKPVLLLAQAHGLPLIAANLSRREAGLLVRKGVAELAADDVVLRQSLAAVPADLQQGQEHAVAVGHCNQLPERLLPAMATAQIARDVVMAEALRPWRERGVVLLAGNGHVRRDLGVPRWILETVSIAFAEPAGEDATVAGRYDRVIAIAGQEREDPCRNVKK